MWMNNKKKNS